MNGILSPILEYARAAQTDQQQRWQRLAGRRIDLHCHSTFSDETLRWPPGIGYPPVQPP